MNADMKRRLFLKQSLAASAMGMLVGTGLLMPKAALAVWPAEAFRNKDLPEALKVLLGSNEHTKSSEIKLTAPEKAENGAIVPITIETAMADVESITIVAINNPLPLIASFKMGEGALPYIATWIKMGKSGEVTAIVKADGKLYSAQRMVEVAAGGC